MTEQEVRTKVINGLECCLEGLSDICPYKDSDAPGGCKDELMYDALALLKAQDERYKNLVISWLDEIAINNVDCNDKMTFLDAVDDIRDRASYGLMQYFYDK